jgi:hypothetical protein
MPTLLSQEWVGGRLEKTWLHVGEDGRKKITVEVIQDVEPVMEQAKVLAQNAKRNSFLRFKAHVTGTQLEEACRIHSKLWGIPFQECFREVMQGKTDRAQGIWRTLTEGRDFAKLQAKHWR